MLMSGIYKGFRWKRRRTGSGTLPINVAPSLAALPIPLGRWCLAIFGATCLRIAGVHDVARTEAQAVRAALLAAEACFCTPHTDAPLPGTQRRVSASWS